jgi:cell division protein FtsB
MAHAAAPSRRGATRRRTGPGGIRWDRVGRYALLGTLVVILLLYVSPAKHWLEQSRTAGEQKSELRELTRENRELRRRARQLRDPRALEREARRLGLVRHGERSFVIENLPKR